MGLFGGGKSTININIPEPDIRDFSDIQSQATGQFQSNFPNAFRAREGALADLSRGTDFFESFQPTSLEQAIANQQFANIIPDVEKNIMHRLSLSGVASSPIAARLIGQARGNLGVDIASQLANLGNQRAISSLNARLGINPNQEILPFTQLGVQQNIAKAQLAQQRALVQAQVDLANQIKAMQPSGLGRVIGAGIGGLGGFLGGGPAGALTGIGLGGGIGSIFGGDFGIGDALGLYGGISNIDKLGFGGGSGDGGRDGGSGGGGRGAGIFGIGGVNERFSDILSGNIPGVLLDVNPILIPATDFLGNRIPNNPIFGDPSLRNSLINF